MKNTRGTDAPCLGGLRKPGHAVKYIAIREFREAGFLQEAASVAAEREKHVKARCELFGETIQPIGKAQSLLKMIESDMGLLP